MDELNNDMGIEINYANPDGQVPESDRNNKLIKDIFRIAYYRLPYKKMPSIMISHLAMNVMRYFNLFPTKIGVLNHYIPHIIMSQKKIELRKNLG